ncbi:transcriptional regulator protein (plasmid) [Rhizobium phaseoli]|uniref:PadR family transcriptional regulator n=1 Tax=Rhizobium TaxID=379 RepID=UPI0007E97F5C|nr:MULTISPECIES: PadR family transcriptional regulator [Rhizobium]ANL69934.1 transcriptional regulator protein [Rhizobium phaseoli]ANL82726.1 transcriptional regulator protein [Rhizobium phaseoli]ANM08323.1 transcriptional regulator protein [Rhizobium phaseoli]ARQ62112.1 transcriptional regulator protein [Rhizobium sp. Kim5]PDS69859.1 PadR family transcriptional regulator [Rhizobium phaseoli]
MSSIRFFILSCFEEIGPTHGHHLRKEAERKRMPLWTDVTVGAVYGAIGRLASEGLLREIDRQSEGNRPARQIFEITPEGRAVLQDLRRQLLEEVWFRYDPFDLGISVAEGYDQKWLYDTLIKRREATASMLEQRRKITTDAMQCVSGMQVWALKHSERRLAADLEFLDELIASAFEKPALEANG